MLRILESFIKEFCLFQGTLADLREKQTLRSVIAFETDNPEKAAAILSSNGIAPIVANGQVTIPLVEREVISKLNRQFVDAGVDVYQIKIVKNDLESIFMDLVKDYAAHMKFLHCFQSEWLKTRRSLSSWLVIIGALFTPTIVTIVRLVRSQRLHAESISPKFWETLWTSSWESMAIFLLPLGIILAASLVTQIEYKNNTWKQLHTTPQSLTTIFFAKLTVIMVMLVQFFFLFNIGIYLSGILPCLLTKESRSPRNRCRIYFF